jgi:serine/threonine protein kinase
MTPTLPMVGEEFAGYVLRSVLGRGGMSVVFQAENPRLGSVVALKVLAPDLAADDVFRARFLQESRIAAALSHPNVIPIFDTGPHDGLLYIAMRYVAGSDLRSVLKARGHLDPEQTLTLIGQAGRALDAAHRAGLVHRDIKPANFLIERGADNEPDHVYLADFGITKNALSRSGLTETGQFVGTIDYIAPEQIQGKQVDGRADIYSLGCVLYECLTGRVPFQKDLDAAVIWAHVEELPAPPSTIRPELPAAIDDVIAKALAKDPNDRYQTSRELVEAARAAFGDAPQAAPSQGSGPQTVLSGVSPQRDTPHPVTGGTVSSAPTPQQPQQTDTAAATGPSARGAETATAVTAGAPASQSPGRRRLLVPAIVAGVLVAAVVAIVLAGGGSSKKKSPAAPVESGEASNAALEAVPSNRVDGAGTATVHLNGSTATITVDTHGLLNNAPHAMHIHAGGLGECPPASAARPHNGHLAISTTDGIHFYGPVETALTTSGDTSIKSFLVFSRFPNTGAIRYKRKVALTPTTVKRLRENNAVIMIHGIDYDSNGIYDNVLDRSELDATEPGEATAPALCGALKASASAATAAPRPSRTYVARLAIESDVWAWLCEPPAERPQGSGYAGLASRGEPTL